MGFLDDFSYDDQIDWNPDQQIDFSGGGGDYGWNPQSQPRTDQFLGNLVPSASAPEPPPPSAVGPSNPNAGGITNRFRSLRPDSINAQGAIPSNDLSDYWDPTASKAYRDLAASSPASEGLIQSYLSKMPTREQYEPGFGRKMAGFLLGTLSGRPDATSKFLDAPYMDALADWKQQGTSVQNEARLADASRSRELGAMKYDLDAQAKGKRQSALDAAAKDRIGIDLAKGDSKAEHDAEILNLRKEHEQEMQDARKQSLDLRQQLQDLREERLRDQEAKAGKAGSQLGSDDLSKFRGMAAEVGVPFTHITTREELASDIAKQRLTQDPAWRDLFNEAGDDFVPNVDPARKRLFDITLSNTVKRLLGGR